MQNRLFSTLACASILVGLTGWLTAGESTDSKTVVGTWSATRGTSSIKLEFTKDLKFTLSKDRNGKGETFSGTYKLDAKAKPASIDMTVTGGSSDEAAKFKDKISLGIVKIAGDKLEWCANEPGKDARPKLFAGKDGDQSFLYITFTREKK